MLKVALLSVFAFCNIHMNDYFHKNQHILLNLEQSTEQKFIMAIKENDFHTIKNIITNNLIEINEYYEGKTFVIWAGIYNKPEIVRMLVDFGADLTRTGSGKSCSNSIRVLYQTSAGDAKQIETVTITTQGNGIQFGELTQANDGGSFATSDPTRGLFGLNTPSGGTNIMEYISMSTGGKTVDFGDLTQAITNSAASSNAHGGL